MILGALLGLLLLAYLLACFFNTSISTPIAGILYFSWFLALRLLLLYIVFEGISDILNNQTLQGLIKVVAGVYCFYLAVREIDWKKLWSS
jgi:hypothetical protein